MACRRSAVRIRLAPFSFHEIKRANEGRTHSWWLDLNPLTWCRAEIACSSTSTTGQILTDLYEKCLFCNPRQTADSFFSHRRGRAQRSIDLSSIYMAKPFFEINQYWMAIWHACLWVDDHLFGRTTQVSYNSSRREVCINAQSLGRTSGFIAKQYPTIAALIKNVVKITCLECWWLFKYIVIVNGLCSWMIGIGWEVHEYKLPLIIS